MTLSDFKVGVTSGQVARLSETLTSSPIFANYDDDDEQNVPAE